MHSIFIYINIMFLNYQTYIYCLQIEGLLIKWIDKCYDLDILKVLKINII